ncbi:MAG TPA: PPC domain-containing DNA-binding protein [Chthonomonadaceae bacterium]|nr:PPC domain-containing DNA-binding protein [Chthonomonadaceae bacterium]
MQARLLANQAEKTYALIFETGDEVMAGLRDFARRQQLSGSHFTAIGAFQDVVLAYFEWQKKEYKPIPIQEQVEVVSLVGDIALKDGQPQVHAHVVVAKSDGTAYGGHLLEAHVRPTLEVVLTEEPRHLQRKYDAQSGLALIDLEASEGVPV